MRSFFALYFQKNTLQKGQTLLIVVLVMVVTLTVGLSVATRNISNLKVATEEENSQRALSAAEAGAEQALKSNQSITSENLGNNAIIKQVQITDVSGQEFLVNNANIVSKNDGIDIWLIDHNADGTLDRSPLWTNAVTIYWGSSQDVCTTDSSTNTLAALELVLIYDAGATDAIAHYPIDLCTTGRRTNNNFCPNAAVASCPPTSSSGGTVSGKTFQYSTTLTISNGILLRVIPLYSGTTIGIKGCNAAGTGCRSLPSQGKLVQSTGSSGETQRKITVYKGYPKLPTEFFPFVFFAP